MVRDEDDWLPSGMLRCVVSYTLADVSEELTASFLRAMMEAQHPRKSSSLHRENLKSYFSYIPFEKTLLLLFEIMLHSGDDFKLLASCTTFIYIQK
jgi:hypothetical protein